MIVAVGTAEIHKDRVFPRVGLLGNRVKGLHHPFLGPMFRCGQVQQIHFFHSHGFRQEFPHGGMIGQEQSPWNPQTGVVVSIHGSMNVFRCGFFAKGKPDLLWVRQGLLKGSPRHFFRSFHRLFQTLQQNETVVVVVVVVVLTRRDSRNHHQVCVCLHGLSLSLTHSLSLFPFSLSLSLSLSVCVCMTHTHTVFTFWLFSGKSEVCLRLPSLKMNV